MHNRLDIIADVRNLLEDLWLDDFEVLEIVPEDVVVVDMDVVVPVRS